jgi:hypothetical protein
MVSPSPCWERCRLCLLRGPTELRGVLHCYGLSSSGLVCNEEIGEGRFPSCTFSSTRIGRIPAFSIILTSYRRSSGYFSPLRRCRLRIGVIRGFPLFSSVGGIISCQRDSSPSITWLLLLAFSYIAPHLSIFLLNTLDSIHHATPEDGLAHKGIHLPSEAK